MNEADLLQAVALATSRPLTLRRARMLVQTLAKLDEDAATELVLKWIKGGRLIIENHTESAGFTIQLGDGKPGDLPIDH